MPADPPATAFSADVTAQHTVIPETASESLATVAPVTAWGEYDQFDAIGQGGMGVVYKAHHKRLKRFEAVKLIRSGQFANPRDLERFKFEAEATAALDHPNIIPVYGVGEMNGAPYFAMKWVDGGELANRTQEFRNDAKSAATMMAKVARAVAHAHKQGILHRDLKPSNVLLDLAGEPHVTDFGLAKAVGGPDAKSGLTVTGMVVGTPAYMAPEQARGEKRVTTAADVYGLGAILYEVLTGRAPFTGNSLPEVIKKVASEPPVDPHFLNSFANRDLEAICLRCLEKSPADRYPSAEAVAEDLERVSRGERIAAHQTGVADWVRQVMARRPESFKGYAWEIKLWFGAIMAVAQSSIFGLVLAEVSVGWVWLVTVLAWVGCMLALREFMGIKFTRLPETEKHSMMIAVGHLFGHLVLTLAYVPFTGPASGVLSVYPALAAVSGLSLFVVGTTHWGRFFLIGVAALAMAPVLAIWPIASPLLYGWAMAACMFYWAYAVKVTFAKELAGEPDDAGDASHRNGV